MLWESFMPTRNVVLTEHQAELIEKLVESGRYQNASEVLREGLRLIESREAEDRARLKALREAVKVGLDDLQAGRYRQFDSFADLESYVGKIADRAIAKHRAGQKRR
jgi:antitoxin ParD1/3/4